ncbi:DnaB-like helicase N-terminal domain-containing protein [Streptomyces sp. NPDC094473]|uniref:DnaB-like helicase N-terminal domain-containing protein n=1 Tax=Streptomyces sp. NPDC094473 TaxID=3366068 RepID=UPI0038139955
MVTEGHRRRRAGKLNSWPQSAADPITTAAALGRSGDLNRVGGASYLHTLVQAVPTVAHAEHYARIISEAAQGRRLGLGRDAHPPARRRG